MFGPADVEKVSGVVVRCAPFGREHERARTWIVGVQRLAKGAAEVAQPIPERAA
jgi:hypothetical protein